MGIEYKIKFSVDTDENVDEMLRHTPFFSNYDQNYNLYNYRDDFNTNPFVMPDAHAAIESDGIYFCDNCGKISRLVFEHLKRTASQKYGIIEIVEL